MKKPLPPGPEGGLLGGRVIRRGRQNPLAFMAELATHGDIAHFKSAFQDVFFLNHPD